MADYEHRQYGFWWVTFVLLGLGLFGLTLALAASKGIRLDAAVALGGMGAFFLLIASMLGYLDVRDEGDRLSVRFGPLPLFGTAIRYEDIESAGPTRTTLLHGFGVQGLPGLFLVVSIWGLDAVQLRMRRRHGIWFAKTVLIGTDDAENLLALLQEKIGRESAGP